MAGIKTNQERISMEELKGNVYMRQGNRRSRMERESHVLGKKGKEGKRKPGAGRRGSKTKDEQGRIHRTFPFNRPKGLKQQYVNRLTDRQTK